MLVSHKRHPAHFVKWLVFGMACIHRNLTKTNIGNSLAGWLTMSHVKDIKEKILKREDKTLPNIGIIQNYC